MQKAERSFCEFITGLFYAYVFCRQQSSNPFIQSSMGWRGNNSYSRYESKKKPEGF